MLFAVALAAHAYGLTCGGCSSWRDTLIGAPDLFGAFALWTLELALPTGHWPVWAREIETMALALLSVSVAWLIIRRLLAERVRLWVFLLVLVIVPAATFAINMVTMVVFGLVYRFTHGG